jgi:1-aminocyclopropane-1-carboxylate deaminase
LFPNPIIENVPLLSNSAIKVDTLRLDQIHPVISGNKWYKLRYYIQDALDCRATTMASFGGPYSNHLVALAYASKLNGLKCIGYVRANNGEPITPTLQEAIDYGMELIFLGRQHFQTLKNEMLDAYSKAENKSIYYVDEGGYGKIGAKGASTILEDFSIANNQKNSIHPIHQYHFIICAVGTGTMAAGLINAGLKDQTIIGIPVLKNEGSIENEIRELLINKNAAFTLLHEFHQGGYAKTTNVQIDFMNLLWDSCKIPSDIVYTSKVFFAVNELIKQSYFKPNSSVLVIHSGGLQGNRSVAKGILHF